MMKSETVHTLLIARTLLDQVNRLASSDEKHSASASLIILQDCLELVLIAALVELGIDEKSNIEKFSFDQLIGELRSAGIAVPKSGTLKAMNKARVNVKHYGQVAEPSGVRNYVAASKSAIDVILNKTIGHDLQSIMLHELLPEGEAKQFLKEAAEEIDNGNFFYALVCVRKALFVEVEIDYVIEEWKDDKEINPFSFLMRKGSKAPYHTRNEKWIADNVKEPFNYIQIDHEKVRMDLLEWGVNTQDYWNLWRITPTVYRSIGEEKWQVRYVSDRRGATKDEAEYCLDRAVSLIAKKKSHSDAIKHYERREDPYMPVVLKVDADVYKISRSDSNVVERLKKGYTTTAESVITGLDGQSYFRIFEYIEDSNTVLSGYVLEDNISFKVE